MHGPILNSRVWQRAGKASSRGGAALPAAAAVSRQDRTGPNRGSGGVPGPRFPLGLPSPHTAQMGQDRQPWALRPRCGKARSPGRSRLRLSASCAAHPESSGAATAGQGAVEARGHIPSRSTRRWEKGLLPPPLQSPPSVLRENGWEKMGRAGKSRSRGGGSPRLHPFPVRGRPAARGKHPQLNHVHMTIPK